ncbi:kunitz-type serine protease inhibitor 2-like [Drosophila pseudoobscura]|uniref:Kunitz-type serine protease inhibitor 2-like n=1 Tax=Drosophila pseudoobscura pseudoobscura TaxID=46245 RepID=A0A6I8VVT0_DROPS|nr:kunitz-type serine protease inhibitor 2-like [Drosophila pseudoobscura]XP_033235182.1 kunitz-type serine protease inhibitor 2-like [Drosophila pseudoobscura]
MKFLLILVVLAALTASSLAMKNDICALPHSQKGLCRALMRRWSYDAANRVCTRFIYGGCGGNANRFESQRECEATCME